MSDAAPAAASAEAAKSQAGQLARNSLWSLGAWAATTALNFVAVPITVHQLGAEPYGVLSLLLTVIAPLGLLDFGMGEATVKFMAESLGRGQRKEAEAYFRSTLGFNLGVGCVGAVVLAGLSSWLVHSVFNIPAALQATAVSVLMLVGVNWLVAQVTQTFVGALTALQGYRAIGLGQTAAQALTLGTGILVLLAGGGLWQLVAAQSLCGVIALFGWRWMLRRQLPDFNFTPALHRSALRDTAGMGVWQLVNKVGGIFANRAQFWLLGVLLPVAAVGYYNLCYQVVTLAYMVAFRVGMVIFPAVSRLEGEGRSEEAATQTVLATWLSSAVGAALIAVIIAHAHDMLRLWVNLSVADASTGALRLLAAHNGISMLFAVPNFYLLGSGRAHWLAWMAIIQGTITFSAAAFFIPLWGLAGAALGVFVGSAAHVGILGLLWVRVLRRWMPAATYFGALAGPVLIGIGLGYAGAYLRQRFGHSVGWGGLLLNAGGTFAAAVLALLWLDAWVMPGGRARVGRVMSLAYDMLASAGLPALARLLVRAPSTEIKRLDSLPERPDMSGRRAP